MNIFPMSGLASGPSIVTQWKGTSVKFLSDKILFFVPVRKSPIFFLSSQTNWLWRWWKEWNITQCISTLQHHTHVNGPYPGQPGWADTRKVKPIWILLKQETVSGSGISWAICKQFAPHSRQITTPTTDLITLFLRAGCSSWCPTNSVKALKATDRKYHDFGHVSYMMWHDFSPLPWSYTTAVTEENQQVVSSLRPVWLQVIAAFSASYQTEIG